MDRTKAIDNVAVRPAPSGSTHAAGYFDDGTTVEAEFLNGVMDSLVVPLEDGGITPDTDDYEQFATLLSGVHGTISSIRTNLATTGASTYDKQAASAVSNAKVDGDCSQCNAGVYQTAHGNYSQCNAGVNQTANGDYSQCNAGLEQNAHGTYSQCNAGVYQHNSGARASVIGGKYFENIDNNCVCGGYGTSVPADFGDGLTNKNIKWKLHNDTGNAEFSGEVTATGGLSTVTPAKFVAAYDLTDMRWEVTIDAIGGIIEIPFDSSFPLDGAILKMTNSKFGSGSRMYCQPVAPPTLTQTHGFVVNVNTSGEMYFYKTAADIEETVQVWFDIINPV